MQKTSEPTLERYPQERNEASQRRHWELIGQHTVLSTFVVALAVRGLVAVALTVAFGGSLVPDDSTYSTMASQVAAGERGSWDAYTHELYRSTFAFLGPVSAIYSVVGPVKLAAQLFVALLGALTAAATTSVALGFLAPRRAIVAGLVVALLPSQILWSSLILKDAAVWFALSCLAWIVSIAARSSGWRLLPLASVAAFLLLVLAHLREHTLVVASFSVALASLAGVARHRLLRIGGAAALAVSIPWMVGIGPAGLTLVTDAGSLEQRRILNAEGARTAFINAEPDQNALKRAQIAATQADIKTLRARVAHTNSPDEKRELLALVASLEAKVKQLKAKLRESRPEGPLTATVDPSSLDPDLRHLPMGVRVMLLEPVPWQTGGSSAMRLARLEALVWYPLLVVAAIGLWISRKHLQSLAFPLLAGGGMLFVYALTEGNVGTAFRHRGEFVWVVALLAALGLNQSAVWRQQRRLETVQTKRG